MTQTTVSMLQLKLGPFCRRLAGVLKDPVVLLSGSMALGESTPLSDVDLVVIAGFQKPFLERLGELALLNETGLPLEILGYTRDEFIDMLDRLNALAIEALEFGIPIMRGAYYAELRQRLMELKGLGLKRTNCTYLLESNR